MYLKVSIQAFYATEETGAVFNCMRDDRRFMRANVNIWPGGIGAAIKSLSQQEPADLLIVEADKGGEEFLRSLDELADVCDPSTKVILLGVDNDILLYRDLLAMGVDEYLPCPVKTEQLLPVVDRLFASEDDGARSRILAFVGARGGVGSSSVAVNTAYCLAEQMGEEVVLLDLDLSFGTAALSLNLLPNQTIADALVQSARLDDVMLERFLSSYGDNSRLSVIAAPGQLDGGAELDMGAFDLLMKVVSRRASFVILDLPHLWSNWMYEVLVGATEVVITTHPDLVGLRAAKNFFEQLTTKRGVDAPTRLVMNEVGASRSTELAAKEFEKAVSVRPSIVVPNNPTLFGTAMNDGEPVVKIDPRSEAAKEFSQLAAIVSGRRPAAVKRPRFRLFRGRG